MVDMKDMHSNQWRSISSIHCSRRTARTRFFQDDDHGGHVEFQICI